MTRPRPRSVLRWLAAPAVGVLLVVLAACGASGPGAADATTPPPGSDSVGSAPPPSGPPPTTGSGGGGGGGGGTPTGGPPEALPASWRLCQNPSRGTSMGYPGDWFTTELRPAEKCSQFHPDEFTIPEAGEYPLTALNAVQTTQTPAAYVAAITDPMFATTLLREPTTVLGRAATRIETRSTGEGLYEAGTRWYGYVINRGGKAFVLFATAQPGETRYSSWKFVVDTAKGTLRFL
jgi:hypothetical protein